MKKAKGKVVEEIAEVDLFPDLLWIWDAFIFLNNRRQFTKGDIAMVAQSFSMEAVKAYADMTGVSDEEERIEFMRLIDLLDSEWKKHYAAQIEQHRQSLESKSNRKSRR